MYCLLVIINKEMQELTRVSGCCLAESFLRVNQTGFLMTLPV